MQRRRPERIVRLVQLVHRRIAEEAVRESCRVRHQLPDSRRDAPGLLEPGLAGRVVAGVHLQVGELGDVAGERIVGVPLALLVSFIMATPVIGLLIE